LSRIRWTCCPPGPKLRACQEAEDRHRCVAPNRGWCRCSAGKPRVAAVALAARSLLRAGCRLSGRAWTYVRADEVGKGGHELMQKAGRYCRSVTTQPDPAPRLRAISRTRSARMRLWSAASCAAQTGQAHGHRPAPQTFTIGLADGGPSTRSEYDVASFVSTGVGGRLSATS
jgi:hypothetical protein